MISLSEDEISALLLSLRVAATGTLFGLPIAIAVGILIARVEFRGKFLVSNLVHLPMVLPPVATGYLLLILLARDGFLGSMIYNTFGVEMAFTWRAAAVAAAVMGFPLMVRAVRISIEMIDRQAESAARILGASRTRMIWKITLPLALPGIISGAMMGFGRALGEFGATVIVAANIPGATRTIPLALYHALQSPDGEAAAIRFVVIALGIAAVAIAASEYMLRFMRYDRRI